MSTSVAMAGRALTAREPAGPLTGGKLLLAALAIGLGNFLVVLDTSIANVSVSTISGALGVSSTQGTWVITSYAVAEAITVPLTGWLAKRFGAQRVFITCYLAFAALSVFCGLANSLGMLVLGRVLLGMVGGPIMPLSQLLLLRVFPPEKATQGTVLWAMTSLVGPIAGPILGGVICDSMTWNDIFILPAVVALGGGMLALWLLKGQPDPREPASIDKVGFALLVVWVAAFQIMLDEGRNHDWFAAAEIRWLAVIAAIGFAAFLIWESTEENPVVDLKVFRHRGFAAAAVTFAVGFGAFFAGIVIIPLWLQQNMGYTATWAGMATGLMGVLAIVSSPIVGTAVNRFDPRLIVSIGLVGLGAISVWRMGFNQDITFWQMAWPTLLTGPFMVMLFIPVTGIAMASVEPHEQASAAGLSNFMRTMGGAIGTSLVQTSWADSARFNQSELAGAMANGQQAIDNFVSGGLSHDGATSTLTSIVEGQSVMLATLDVFAAVALCFGVAAALIWLAPRPKGPIDTSGGH
ncbi:MULTISPECIES: DHA2 family efflux MFS transporter permease subunit [unclassified Novosphingobium]|uniref:DHA2 family efflux MFS transporter permease subunit n=1 Tax=unclassified Novosphingobium TaxID=2644732 RepID=UPI00146A878C|nr:MULTISPECIES: DHA2 family efflux MFS transporter permease subunit [unclassified Novosphingobium]NMN05300.1 DHA2 family multidrug resistance protein [Novosphingobium sp. SG919]NMN87595.1 DHA2 family multidrug resistance protein [Novosphingobium sp. SG916]